MADNDLDQEREDAIHHWHHAFIDASSEAKRLGDELWKLQRAVGEVYDNTCGKRPWRYSYVHLVREIGRKAKGNGDEKREAPPQAGQA